MAKIAILLYRKIFTKVMDKERQFKESIVDALKADDKKVKSVVVPSNFNIIVHRNNKIIVELPDGKQLIDPINPYYEYAIIGDYISANLHKFTTDELAIIGYISTHIKFNSNIIYMAREDLEGFKGRNVNLRNYYTAIAHLSNRQIISQTEINNVYVVNPICIFKGHIRKYLEYCKNNLVDGKIIKNANDNKVCFNKAAIITKDTIITIEK